ncbi:MAG: DoxX family membrane protein [Planctomycetota bacterium]
MQEPTPARELDAYQPGVVIDDFQLIRQIGSSADARVFFAYQRSMQRGVALRISLSAPEGSVEFGQFEHPHIVRIYDQRQLGDPPLRLLYMPYHPGGDLRHLVTALQQQSPEAWDGKQFLQVLDDQLRLSDFDPPVDSLQRERIQTLARHQLVSLIGAQLAEALDHAHRGGFYHGRLSADHIVLSETAMPQLLRLLPQAAGALGQQQVRQDVGDLVELLQTLLPESTGGSTDVGQLLQRWARAASDPAAELRLPELAHQLQIGMDPDSARLLTPPQQPLRRLAGGAPLAVIVLTLLIPNVIAGVFNYIYNYESIIVPLHADRTFQRVMMGINAIAYPGALVVGIWLVRRLCREVRQRFRGEPTQPAHSSLRAACLAVPHHLALLGIGCWCLAGLAYPIVLRWAGLHLSGVDAIHFFGSLALSGLIGAAYPFFGAAVVVTSVWYPALIRPGLPPPDDLQPLQRLEQRCGFYVILAGLCEFGAFVGLTFGFWTRIAAGGTALYLLIALFSGGHDHVGFIW